LQTILLIRFGCRSNKIKKKAKSKKSGKLKNLMKRMNLRTQVKYRNLRSKNLRIQEKN